MKTTKTTKTSKKVETKKVETKANEEVPEKKMGPLRTYWANGGGVFEVINIKAILK
ncbi:hypothetical protein [Viscerimonas tarda]